DAFRKRFLAVLPEKAKWRGCASGVGSASSAANLLGAIFCVCAMYVREVQRLESLKQTMSR
ncbi:hypothetical protein CH063_15853, partial [Colletotrichum higginsianum]